MKHEILLVDAERRTLRVLDVALRGAGYSVQVARDGVEALERARDTPPDIIVTDSGRPGFDAYGMIERLKEGLETSVVPVVLLASRVTAEDELRALAEAVREERAASGDAALEAVLDQIETRAAVELAKRGA